jgi:outer membrane biosynthesis protein TonB
MLAPAHVEEVFTLAAATPAPVPPAASETLAQSSPAPAPALPDTPAEATGAGGPFGSRVVITDSVPRARFGEFLESENLAGFPPEIDQPVRIGKPLVVPYPPRALRERREDTVVLWAVVDADGIVEKFHFAEGTPEFVRAVTLALRTTRFVPAENNGSVIRFYILLELQFRIDARSGDASASGVVTAAPR